jgi:arylsulfatase A-like enzyme
LIIGWACVLPGRAQNGKPNVVFILTDDMGYGDIGSYGVPDIRTPHLDRLAREGVRLPNTYANGSVCTPTRAAFITGRYQQRVGLEYVLTPATAERGLAVSETSVARMLKDNGYATAVFGKWHLGYRPEFSPNAHGFDEFFGFLGSDIDHYAHRRIDGTPDLWENTRPVQRTGYMTDLITDRAVSFINRHRRDPFFIYVAYNAPHWPFQPPGRPDDIRTAQTWLNGNRGDYALMVQSIDSGVGRILQALDRHGLAKDTLVIFTNDNGGERYSRNEPFFNRKFTLWEGGIRVPCIMRWPGQLPAGAVSDQAAITLDMTATILAATDTEPPEERPLDGINLLPILQGKEAPVLRTLFWRTNQEFPIPSRQRKAVRHGDWKYVQDTFEMLFDLRHDPGERTDLSYQHPEVVQELRRLLAKWEQDVGLLSTGSDK